MKNERDIQSKARMAAVKAKEVGLTQVDISKGLGVSQSQVSRILSGRISRPSALLEKICIYVDGVAGKVSAEQVRGNDQLIGALVDIWDGTTTHAEALAAVIRSLGVLSQPTLQKFHKG